jgi:hypothetical protein
MKQEADHQDDLQRPDNRVGCHKMCPVREGGAAVVDKDHGVNGGMHHQKADQEEPCQRHHDFLANRACQRLR